MDPVDEPGALRDEDDDGVWAIVETHKNVGAIFTYRGKIRRSDLEAWREGTLGGALTLRQAYWVDEDPDTGRVTPIVVGRHTSFRHGTGVLHLAADTVVVVMEIRTPDPGVLEGEAAQVLRLGAVRGPRSVSASTSERRRDERPPTPSRPPSAPPDPPEKDAEAPDEDEGDDDAP